MAGDVETMVAVGLVWGATNALMRRGAHLSDRKLGARPSNPLGQWLHLLFTWQYSLPFFINLSASAAFFHILRDSPISLAVPVTNATTFATTAAAAYLLGEEMRVGLAFLGIGFIILGVWICIS
ncbi:hypothetical protein J5N97_019753 [Dioscorea zingiberensis]|uniref:Transmembrane protein 234 homolog n=1 Tax=Dioscorea zingiberensis TaxID=325984 RepID=A0A9D5HCS9_9LILI|nr:hypothetical protein J5N97_019753 [Dioscorea zingiberensis]